MTKYLADQYREAAAASGKAEQASVCLLRDAWVADSLEEVERVWWPHARPEHWWLFKELPSWIAGLEPYGDTMAEEDFTFEQHRVNRLIVGTPQDCVTAIKRFEAEIDMDYLIMSFRQGGGPSFADEAEAVRRFGEEVIPAFRAGS